MQYAIDDYNEWFYDSPENFKFVRLPPLWMGDPIDEREFFRAGQSQPDETIGIFEDTYEVAGSQYRGLEDTFKYIYLVKQMERTEMLATKSLNITDELMYHLPSSKKSQISRREHVSKSADGSQTANPSQTIIFTIPLSSNKVLAGSKTYFSFKVASAGAATLGGSVHRLIERVRILSDSGVVLEELNAFNVLNR